MINRINQVQTTSIAPRERAHLNFNDLKLGTKKVNDITIEDFNSFKRANKRLADKKAIERAIADNDITFMGDVSEFFFRISGMYRRIIEHMAQLYRYDYMVTPYIMDKTKAQKVSEQFNNVLYFLDKMEVKKVLSKISLEVLIRGNYYCYAIPTANSVIIQELPRKYCRSRFSAEGRPLVEFNLAYFENKFPNEEQRKRILNVFPEEIRKAYMKYKNDTLTELLPGETRNGWCVLDAKSAFKFSLNEYDYPFMISVIPSIIDYNTAQEIEKKKLEQQLVKLIVQKLPLDKNSMMVFDMDEARDIHSNAVQMVKNIVGTDVLTTFAEVGVESMADNSANNAVDDTMNRIRSSIFDEGGVSSLIFNSDGNISLDKSVLNDAASMSELMAQYQSFLNALVDAKFNKNPKKFYYNVELLQTTQYNYIELSKLYKEQVQLGFGKLLPQIALGHSQSSILATIYFENEVLKLVDLMTPPENSNTKSAASGSGGKNSNGNPKGNTDDKGGRPSKESQGETVSDKTLQNRESQA